MMFYCIRHGESTHNAQGRLQGHSDAAQLSDLGRRQSAAAGEALAKHKIEAIYSSPLTRASETAAIIAERLKLPVQTEPLLKEINVGVFQDKLRSEVENLYPEALARWQSGDPEFRIPNGESRNDLARRGCEAFRNIAQSGYRHVVVVSHGGLIVTTIKTLLGIPLGEPPLALENGSITQLAWNNGEVQIVALNEIGHLRDVGLAGAGDLAV